jgi:U3 small nucleolar RNA-associated protein 15
VLQVFELDDFRVTSASKYPAPVLSMGISPDCSLLAVGMADGMLSVRKHARPRVLQVCVGLGEGGGAHLGGGVACLFWALGVVSTAPCWLWA